MKLWQNSKGFDGAHDKETEEILAELNNSLPFDCKLYKQDIRGSIAHVTMLARVGVLTDKEGAEITSALGNILEEIESGMLSIDMSYEDIHSFVEAELTKRLPVAGKKLHTGRSRNDQVALDMRMWVADETDNIAELLKQLLVVISNKAEENTETVMSGYTHLQRAQPVTFGHHMMAYAAMFLRDKDRLAVLKKHTLVNPLGSGALAGTTYPIERAMTTELLGFEGTAFNTMDAVSDRDYLVAFLSAMSLIMMHLSRLAEELIIWSSSEFGYISLAKEFTTGSSIMPQKRNPDMAELARGKAGRVFGHLTGLLTTLKGLPLAYNKDMQEDKEAVFDSAATVVKCLKVFIPMIDTMKVNAGIMLESAKKGFIAATDMADYLVGKGVPFRDAYIVISNLVDYCTEQSKVFEDLTLEEYKSFSDKIEKDIYKEIDLKACVERRKVFGGPAKEKVLEQIAYMRSKL